MKVVVNRCFGGFGLSDAAILKLAATDCAHIKRHEPRAYYGGREGWETKFAEDKARTGFMSILVIDGKIITDEHRGDGGNARACPRLVTVVEEIGAEADGRCAKLRIVEVPDDAKWEIDEYDGNEHVAETHRTWP